MTTIIIATAILAAITAATLWYQRKQQQRSSLWMAHYRHNVWSRRIEDAQQLDKNYPEDPQS